MESAITFVRVSAKCLRSLFSGVLSFAIYRVSNLFVSSITQSYRSYLVACLESNYQQFDFTSLVLAS